MSRAAPRLRARRARSAVSSGADRSRSNRSASSLLMLKSSTVLRTSSQLKTFGRAQIGDTELQLSSVARDVPLSPAHSEISLGQSQNGFIIKRRVTLQLSRAVEGSLKRTEIPASKPSVNQYLLASISATDLVHPLLHPEREQR